LEPSLRAYGQIASAAMDRADALGLSGNLFAPDLALGVAGVAVMLTGIVLMVVWAGQCLRQRSDAAAGSDLPTDAGERS
jgi:hypothetical protein